MLLVPHTNYSLDIIRFDMQILAIWWKGLEVHGIIRLMKSEAAQKAKSILQRGGRLGASTRCWSSLAVGESGAINVHKDCRLIT